MTPADNDHLTAATQKFEGDVMSWLGLIADAPDRWVLDEMQRVRDQLKSMDGLTPDECYQELREWFHVEKQVNFYE